jgi:hypothetical protein
MRKGNGIAAAGPVNAISPALRAPNRPRSKCEELLDVADCTASRQALMGLLVEAADSQRQVDIITLLKDDNPLFKRLWEIENPVPGVPPIVDLLKSNLWKKRHSRV